MKIKIPVTSLSEEIQQLYDQSKLHHFGIDYQYNNITAEIYSPSINLDKRWKEVEVFNFTKYLKMDNRYNTYNIKLTPTEIIVEISVTE
jgi:hypothetical protein